MIKKFDISNDPVLTRQQVRDFDAWAIKTAAVPGVILMENAGRSCAQIVIEEIKNRRGSKICVFCGTGNNGGDGFVIARHLKNEAFDVRVILCGPASKIKGDAQINYKIAANMKIPIKEITPAPNTVSQDIESLAGDCDLLVDAIFGTGLSGKLDAPAAKLIEAVNALDKPIVSVDIPSGLDCDTGEPVGASIKAVATVTFAAAKTGFKNPHSKKYTGQVYVASIGITKP